MMHRPAESALVSCIDHTVGRHSDELIYLKEGHCLLDQTLKVCRFKQPGQRLKCDQLETALTMVSAGVGIAVVPELAAKHHPMQGLTIRHFAEPQPTRMVGLMRKRSGGSSQLVDGLLEILDHIDFRRLTD